MTDFNQDEPKAQEEKSFKEQILADLKEANRLREQREEELYQKELTEKATAKKSAEQIAEHEMQYLTEKQDSEILEEKRRLDQVAKAALEQNKIDTTVDQNEINQVLEDLDLVFSAEEALSDQESFLVRATDGVGLSGIPENIDDTSNHKVVADNQEQEPEIKDDNSEASEKLATTPVVEEDMGAYKRSRRRQKTDSLAKRFALILMTTILLVLLGIGFFGYRYVSSAVGALDKTSTEYVTVEIPEGSGNKYIGQILEEAKVIKSATVFNYYTKFKNYSNFQSGYYNFKASMDLDEISELLQEGGSSEPEEPALGKILITEGYTIKQISEAVAKNAKAKKGEDASTPFKAKEFLKLIQDESFIAEMVEKYPKLLSSLPSAEDAVYRLEGYLFPATYSYYEDTTVRDLAEQMISTMNSYMASYYDTIEANDMTVNEVLTLASLVEKEGATDEDRRDIASVFYNRLNIDMALQSNIAILYAMGKLGEKTTLAEDAKVDTDIDSPYNIYTNKGLMPGPVDSPSIAAIDATVNPASTDYYYFVADVTTGTVYYSETFEEHEANVEKYVNSRISE